MTVDTCQRCRKRRPISARGMCPTCYQADYLSRNEAAYRRKVRREVERQKERRKEPEGAAAFAWRRLNARAGAKHGHRRCYATVEVRMTREEFLAWAVPEYEQWFAERPGVTPSVDRIESTGHYEIGNIRLVPVGENRRRNSRNRVDAAPTGTAWCSACQQYRPVSEFYSRTGVMVAGRQAYSVYCKPCMRAYCARKRAEAGLPVRGPRKERTA